MVLTFLIKLSFVCHAGLCHPDTTTTYDVIGRVPDMATCQKMLNGGYDDAKEYRCIQLDMLQIGGFVLLPHFKNII